MYEEVDDSGRGERGMKRETVAFVAPFSLTTPLVIKREVSYSYSDIRYNFHPSLY